MLSCSWLQPATEATFEDLCAQTICFQVPKKRDMLVGLSQKSQLQQLSLKQCDLNRAYNRTDVRLKLAWLLKSNILQDKMQQQIHVKWTSVQCQRDTSTYSTKMPFHIIKLLQCYLTNSVKPLPCSPSHPSWKVFRRDSAMLWSDNVEAADQ